jgi:hypothetical protein
MVGGGWSGNVLSAFFKGLVAIKEVKKTKLNKTGTDCSDFVPILFRFCSGFVQVLFNSHQDNA